MFTLHQTLKCVTQNHGVVALYEKESLYMLLKDALEFWHEDDNNPRLQYIDNDADEVVCTLLGAKGSNRVVITFRDGSVAKFDTVNILHDGKLIHQSVRDVTNKMAETNLAEEFRNAKA